MEGWKARGVGDIGIQDLFQHAAVTLHDDVNIGSCPYLFLSFPISKLYFSRTLV